MNDKIRIAGSIIFLVALFLAVLTASVATAQDSDSGGELVPAGTTNPTSVLYQGYVTVEGSPYDGTGYFKFAVVNAAGNTTYWSNDGTSTGGSQPSASVALSVECGYFTVLLGDTSLSGMSRTLTPSVFASSGRRLRVWFATSASGTFTQLDLVPIAAAPYALNAETLDGNDSGAFQRRVSGTCASGNAIRVINANGTVTCQPMSDHNHWGEAWSGSGVGLSLDSSDNTAGHFSGYSYGVYGEGYNLDGVRGVSTGGGLADNGVYGETNSNYYREAGVYGYSTEGASGVLGRSLDGYGVYGMAEGVYTDTAGVFGYAPAVSNYPTKGVQGQSDSNRGYGVYGVATGADADTVGVMGHASAESDSLTYGVYGQSDSNEGCGVFGYAPAESDSLTYGVFGLSHSNEGHGVYGVATGAYTYTIGVAGYSYDSSTNYPTFGVFGRSNSSGGVGVLGWNYWGGVGVRAQSYSGNIIEGWSGDPYSSYEDLEFYIDNSGNLYATGTKSAVVQTQNHGSRRLYAIESAEVWFEDFGTGQLIGGEATVSLEPIFAQTVNLAETYHVFLTPIGDEPVLLFVTSKGPAGFTVRGVTLSGEPAGATFDWRIVAKRAGYEDQRLESANVEPAPAPREHLLEREPLQLPPLPEPPQLPVLPPPQEESR